MNLSSGKFGCHMPPLTEIETQKHMHETVAHIYTPLNGNEIEMGLVVLCFSCAEDYKHVYA